MICDESGAPCLWSESLIIYRSSATAVYGRTLRGSCVVRQMHTCAFWIHVTVTHHESRVQCSVKSLPFVPAPELLIAGADEADGYREKD